MGLLAGGYYSQIDRQSASVPVGSISLTGVVPATFIYVVNLDEHVTTSLSTSTGNTIAGFRFKSDGTLMRLNGVNGGAASETQIDSGTDWIIPNSASSAGPFYVKAEQLAQTGGGTLSGVLSAWLQISGNRDWTITRINAEGNGTSLWGLTFSLSADGGSTTITSSVGPHNANAERDV